MRTFTSPSLRLQVLGHLYYLLPSYVMLRGEVMGDLLTLRNLFWAATTLAEIVLLLYLVRRKLVDSHLWLVLYLCCTVLQSALAAVMYSLWDFNAPVTRSVIWGSQAVVVTMRFAALCEMARRILARYIGIWAFAQRVLLIVAAGVLAYSGIFSEKRFSMMILTVDRGVELAIASFIVALLLFARYYKLDIGPLDRAPSIGFCLYSCFYVINDSLLEKRMESYLGFWNFMDVITFLASLLIWIQAVRVYAPAKESFAPRRVAPDLYGALSPEVNTRLGLLNDQLAQLLRSESPRT